MSRPSQLPVGNPSHAHWASLTHAWTFHATGNSGANADDIKGSNDASLGGSAVLSDTLGLDAPGAADKSTFADVVMPNGYSALFRAKLDAVGNNSMVYGNGTANDYFWLDSGTNQTELKSGSTFSVADGEKTTLYDYCVVVGPESGSLHDITLFRKLPSETVWTQIDGASSSNSLADRVINTVGSGYTGDALGMTGEVELFFIFDGTALTKADLDSDFPDPYDIVEAPESITLTAKGIHDRVRYLKSSGTYDETVAGTFNGSPTAIEWRFGGSGSWTVGDASPSGGTFSFSASIDGTTAGQGLEVRFSDDTGTTDSDDLFTICEVFLAEADSLANGSATNPQSYTPRTFTNLMWRSSTGWTAGDESNHWPRLFDFMSDDRPIAILNAASGGDELTGIRAATNASNISAAQCVGVNGLLIHGGANEAIPTLNPTTDTASAWSTEVQAVADDYETTYPGCKTYISVSGPVGSGTEANVNNLREGVLLAAAANSNVEIGSNVWWRSLGDNLHPKSDEDCDEYGKAWWFAIRTNATSQPAFSQASHNSAKTEVTVQYDSTLRTGTLLEPNLFEVTDDGTPATISSAAVSGNDVVLTLSTAASGTLLVSTGKGVNNTGIPPQGTAVSLPNSGGSYFPAALPFYGESVVAADDVAPIFASAAVPAGGTTVAVTFVESANPPILPIGGVTGFSIGSDGDAISVLSACRTSSTVVTLTTSRPILDTETVTTSYAGGNVTDSAPSPNSVADFGPSSVTNNSTQTTGAAASYASVADVRNGTDRGDGQTGTLAVPAASQVLLGIAIDATTGTVRLPTEAQVQDGVVFGAADASAGTLVVGGTPSFASVADVRNGTDRGDGQTGTLAVPAASQVLLGVSVDATTGTVRLPSESQVESSVAFGASDALTGTLSVGSGGSGDATLDKQNEIISKLDSLTASGISVSNGWNPTEQAFSLILGDDYVSENGRAQDFTLAITDSTGYTVKVIGFPKFVAGNTFEGTGSIVSDGNGGLVMRVEWPRESFADQLTETAYTWQAKLINGAGLVETTVAGDLVISERAS